MWRWVCLVLTVTIRLVSEDRLSAPAVEFRDLTWWGSSTCGVWNWWPGQDGTPFPTSMGRIDEVRITGPQELVWEHRYYAIESVVAAPDGAVLVGFSLGTLAMRQLQDRRWAVTFTPAGATSSMGTFQTFSNLGGLDSRP